MPQQYHVGSPIPKCDHPAISSVVAAFLPASAFLSELDTLPETPAAFVHLPEDKTDLQASPFPPRRLTPTC
jgi:hypothetical protein